MGIKDIPETLKELEAWAMKYEETNVYFSENNRKCAEATMGLFLRDLPPFLRGFFQHAAVSLFEENIRVALGYEKPPKWIAVLTETLFQVRGLIIRHLFLPRRRPMDPLPKVDAETGRLHREFWAFEPWYVKTTFGNWLSGFLGIAKIVPGPKYKSNGFLPEELGPVELEKSSKEPVQIEALEMLSYAAEKGGIRGCPFQPVGYPFKYGG